MMGPEERAIMLAVEQHAKPCTAWGAPPETWATHPDGPPVVVSLDRVREILERHAELRGGQDPATAFRATGPVCADPECTIPRKPGFPMHGPHDFRAGRPTPSEATP